MKSTLTPLRIRRVAIATAICAAIAILYYFFDPATSRLAPRCMVKSIIGYDCPGCGSQRMIHALLHGNLADAWNANPFLLCFLPFILVWLWIDADTSSYPRAARWLNSPGFMAGIIVVIVIWTIVRNIPT